MSQLAVTKSIDDNIPSLEECRVFGVLVSKTEDFLLVSGFASPTKRKEKSRSFTSYSV